MSDAGQDEGQQGGADPIAPAWGDPLERIPQPRQDELRRLSELQRVWAQQESANRGSSVLQAVPLTGVEVLFLAAASLASPDHGDLAAQVARLHAIQQGNFTIRIRPKLADMHLEGANLYAARLDGAFLSGAHLEGADLDSAYLEGAHLTDAHLSGADLRATSLADADLRAASLGEALLYQAHLPRADLRGADLRAAFLGSAHLEGANFSGAHLEGAGLGSAHLESANLDHAHLEGAILRGASLLRATLTHAFLDAHTVLDHCNLAGYDGVGPACAEVHWNGARLTQLEWDSVRILADEQRAKHQYQKGDTKTEVASGARAAEFQAAARAYRLLSSALLAQGAKRPATRFQYRAELMERRARYYEATSQ